MSVYVSNLKEINFSFDKIAKKLKIDVIKLQKKVALDIFARLIESTPVDTGRAAGNWNISISQPDYSEIDRKFEEAELSGKAASSVGVIEPMNYFGVIWIANSVPYIVFLNEGSSIQAPRNFVQMSVEEVTGAFR